MDIIQGFTRYAENDAATATVGTENIHCECFTDYRPVTVSETLAYLQEEGALLWAEIHRRWWNGEQREMQLFDRLATVDSDYVRLFCRWQQSDHGH